MHKSKLVDAIWTFGECRIDALSVDTKYILDGWSLKLTWPSNSTFDDICNMYSTDVISKNIKSNCLFLWLLKRPNQKKNAHIRRF